MSKKIVIVGGVAGGATAAARLRRLDESLEIVLLEQDGHVSYANCGLPYHIGGVIPEEKSLLVQTAQGLRNRYHIDVRTGSRVTGVDGAHKTVRVEAAGREYEESYDVLLLSPGSEPVRPPVPGVDLPKVVTLRTIADTQRIRDLCSGGKVGQATVVGGGFIGLEMAENLRRLGVEVTLVEAAPHVMPPMDGDLSVLLEAELEKHGVELVLGDGLHAIHEEGGSLLVETEKGYQVGADLVVLAVGVRPATAFLEGSGIDLGPRGHIIVDDQLRTNLPDVYAVGDAIQVKDFVTGTIVAVPLAGPANKQGRVAADVICGRDSHYEAAQGTSILKVFDLTGACTGLNERTLKALEIPYLKAVTHAPSHAGYYPGATPITCKLLFSHQGQILGCQMVGREGVDKRMDVVATAMRLDAHVTELADLELAYAPPFSSAKDPVNVLGYMAEDLLNGTAKSVDWEEALNRDYDRSVLLDVRTVREAEAGRVNGSVNIPVDELRGRMGELDKDKKLYVYCGIGLRGYVACRMLTQAGFDAVNVAGGYTSYTAQQMENKQ
ncbi:MAG TPA: FAD-dependent oxidoreductase [Firmicutes bacterium]|nr:FAD-dependent oxidoreductase [Bacillota bacterium]